MKKIIIILAFFSCSKADKCETWTVVDYCRNGCRTPTYLEIMVCGDDLKNAFAGNEIILVNDGSYSIIRKYIKQK